MSAHEGWFIAYFLIGVILMIVAVASPGHRKRTKGLAVFAFGSAGDEFDAVLWILVAVLWPVWLVVSLVRRNPRE